MINILISKTINVITTSTKYFKKQTRGVGEWSADVAETSVGGNWEGEADIKIYFHQGNLSSVLRFEETINVAPMATLSA
jgi:hypothetical protein